MQKKAIKTAMRHVYWKNNQCVSPGVNTGKNELFREKPSMCPERWHIIIARGSRPIKLFKNPEILTKALFFHQVCQHNSAGGFSSVSWLHSVLRSSILLSENTFMWHKEKKLMTWTCHRHEANSFLRLLWGSKHFKEICALVLVLFFPLSQHKKTQNLPPLYSKGGK